MRPSCQFQYTPYRPNGCGGAANCIVTHGRATDALNTAQGNKTDKERVCSPARHFPPEKESRADHSGFPRILGFADETAKSLGKRGMNIMVAPVWVTSR